MKMGKHVERPKREINWKKIVMTEIAVILLAVMILGGVRLYALNQCAEVGIADAVYSLPTGVSCKIQGFLIPLDELKAEIRKHQTGENSG